MYIVAHASLTISVYWMEEFIRFIDDTYNECVDSKFNSKKAWNITTRLARTLLMAISEPRSGLSKYFRTRKPRQIKETVFHSTLKSLEIMTDLSKSGFQNSPIVANEIVKFLAKNTQVEAIDGLTKELADMKRDHEKMKMDLKEALDKVSESAKISNAANNKSDQNKTNYEAKIPDSPLWHHQPQKSPVVLEELTRILNFLPLPFRHQGSNHLMTILLFKTKLSFRIHELQNLTSYLVLTNTISFCVLKQNLIG